MFFPSSCPRLLKGNNKSVVSFTRQIKNQLLASVVILLSVSAHANAQPTDAEQIFQVEIILFRYLTPHQDADESWPKWRPLPLPEDSVPIPVSKALFASEPSISTQVGIKNYAQVPVNQLALSALVKRLASSANFKPLLHLGWYQTALAKHKSLPVIFYPETPRTEQDEVNETTLSGFPGKANCAQSPYDTACDGTSLALQDGHLYPEARQDTLEYIGILHLYRNRVLGAAVNIQVTNLANDPAETFPRNELLEPGRPLVKEKTGFVMKETRGIRAGQIYYFDHPKIGLLLQVTEVKKKASETDTNLESP